MIIVILLAMLAVGMTFELVSKKTASQENLNDDEEVSRGILLVFAGHIVALILIFLSSLKGVHINLVQTLKTFLTYMYAIQLIYVIPLIVVGATRKNKGILKGVLITAGITFLLSVISCSVMCSTGKLF